MKTIAILLTLAALALRCYAPGMVDMNEDLDYGESQSWGGLLFIIGLMAAFIFSHEYRVIKERCQSQHCQINRQYARIAELEAKLSSRPDAPTR